LAPRPGFSTIHCALPSSFPGEEHPVEPTGVAAAAQGYMCCFPPKEVALCKSE